MKVGLRKNNGPRVTKFFRKEGILFRDIALKGFRAGCGLHILGIDIVL